ncbi:hypothetical protein NQZ68_028741 [Dissostichus eleginoides]|nr:hypothetical protein NQZ68_028741 [Dissostichus eleginoides]
MSPTHSFRLFVLCLWLLLGYVNCKNTQRGYVQSGQAPVGVHNDNREYNRWSEPPIMRTLKAGYGKMCRTASTPCLSHQIEINRKFSSCSGNATAVPPVTGEWSTKTALTLQTEGRDAELTSQASNPEGHLCQSMARPLSLRHQT